MTQLQSADGTGDQQSSLSATCAKCGGTMKVVRIVPERPGHEVRTLKCESCETEVSEVFRVG